MLYQKASSYKLFGTIGHDKSKRNNELSWDGNSIYTAHRLKFTIYIHALCGPIIWYIIDISWYKGWGKGGSKRRTRTRGAGIQVRGADRRKIKEGHHNNNIKKEPRLNKALSKLRHQKNYQNINL